MGAPAGPRRRICWDRSPCRTRSSDLAKDSERWMCVFRVPFFGCFQRGPKETPHLGGSNCSQIPKCGKKKLNHPQPCTRESQTVHSRRKSCHQPYLAVSLSAGSAGKAQVAKWYLSVASLRTAMVSGESKLKEKASCASRAVSRGKIDLDKTNALKLPQTSGVTPEFRDTQFEG